MNRNLFPNLTRLSFMILHEVNMDYMRGVIVCQDIWLK